MSTTPPEKKRKSTKQAALAALKRKVNQGHAAALRGPNVPVSVMLADLDAVLKDWADESEQQSDEGKLKGQSGR